MSILSTLMGHPSAAQRAILRDTGISATHTTAVAMIRTRLDTVRRRSGLPPRRYDDIEPRHSDAMPINWRAIIDPLYTEDEPSQREIDARLTPLTRLLAQLWPTIWRACAVALATVMLISLSGCGGGTEDDFAADSSPTSAGWSTTPESRR